MNPSSEKIPELVPAAEQCCGCSACYAVCPVKAITMHADREGFLYPEIDPEKCVGCCKCLHVCIFKTDQKKKGYIKGEN